VPCTQARYRPITAKLRKISDKHFVLSYARKMSEIAEFLFIGLALDESLEIRRRSAMKRLHHRATQEGRQPSLSLECDRLFVDDIFFSLNDGLIRSGSNVNYSNQLINGYQWMNILIIH